MSSNSKCGRRATELRRQSWARTQDLGKPESWPYGSSGSRRDILEKAITSSTRRSFGPRLRSVGVVNPGNASLCIQDLGTTSPFGGGDTLLD